MAIVLAIVSLLLVGIGCGEEHESEVVEGEPIELGDLRFNVQLTRYLNPENVEDAEYLQGLPTPPGEKGYLAVFMGVENEGDEDLALPGASEMEVKDTSGATYEPIETESLFALDLGGTIEAGGEAPAGDTAAANGPVQGAFVLFLLDDAAAQNRPLELEVEADGEHGVIELDI